MTFSRWPAVIILGALIVGAWVVDRDHEREDPAPVDAATPLEASGLMPVAPPDDAISSTWYCAGGTATDDGAADTTIIVANATDRELTGMATIFPAIPPQIEVEEPDLVDAGPGDETTTTTEPPATTAPTTSTPRANMTVDPVTVDIAVPAHDRIELRLGDEVDAEHAAALIELAGGAVAVEQQVEGPNGADVTPCVTQAADTWYFADGQTTADTTESLAFFNPFPDPAVVDVTFRVEDSLRAPEQFVSYSVPARTLVVEDLDTVVPRHVHVSVSVIGRSGRLVVNRLLDIDGSEGPRGLEVSAGASRPATTWYFPDGIVAEGIRETFIVYNPTDTAAEVGLELEPDDVDRFGAVEPFILTIPAEGFQEVALHEEDRIAQALDSAGGENVFAHGSRVVSDNDVPVVVERVIEGTDENGRPGYDLMLGAPLLTEEAVLAASGPNETIVIANPSGTTPVRVTVRSLDAGSLGESASATDLEVPIAGRLVLTVAELDLGSNVPLLIEADGPVTIERRLVLGDPADTTGAIAIPLAGSVSEPPSRFGD